MRTKIGRWGNSLALRVPRHLANEAGLTEGAVVELIPRHDGFVVAAVTEEVPPLEELLARITDANLHQPVDSGPAIGAETW